MTPRLAGWIGLALSAVAAIFALAVYDRLPGAMPVHWGISGHADGFAAKPAGPFVFPGIVAALSLLTWTLPALSPRRFRMEPFGRVYGVIMLAIILALTWMTAVVFAGALGAPIPVDRAVLAAIGPLFMVIGNVQGKLTPNFYVGFRTPWTIASPEVWRRTHRLGGRLMVAGGALLFIGVIAGLPIPIPLAVLLALVLAPVPYSWWLYRRLERRGELGDEP